MDFRVSPDWQAVSSLAKKVAHLLTASFFFEKKSGHDAHGVRGGKMTRVELKNGRYRNLAHMWQSARTRELIRSLRDDEQVQSRTKKRKWLRTHDESEWSLNNSLM